MRLDSSGNIFFGNQNDATLYNNTSGGGLTFVAANRLDVARDSDVVATFNRTASDGQVIQIYRSGSFAGSIAVKADSSNNYMIVGKGSVGMQYASDSEANSILPARPDNQGLRDAAIDLGASGARFKDLWLSGGVYLGGTAGGNRLEEYEHGSHAVTAVGATSGSLSFTSNNSLAYARIGRVVHVQGQLAVASTSGTLSGAVRFSLPFSVANLGDIMERGVGTCAMQGVNHGGFSTVTNTQDHGVSFFTILITSNNGNYSILGIDQISSGDDFRFGFTYITTD
jgi:hypothetical protein